jgi:hypothetical protein
MKRAILLLLLLTSSAFAETPTRDEDVLWECGAETEMEGVVQGKYYTEYSEYTYQVFPTPNSGVYLVKEGIRDMNAGALFLFDKEWLATESKSADGGSLYRSQKDPQTSLTVKDTKGSSTDHEGSVFHCEKNPW